MGQIQPRQATGGHGLQAQPVSGLIGIELDRTVLSQQTLDAAAAEQMNALLQPAQIVRRVPAGIDLLQDVDGQGGFVLGEPLQLAKFDALGQRLGALRAGGQHRQANLAQLREQRSELGGSVRQRTHASHGFDGQGAAANGVVAAIQRSPVRFAGSVPWPDVVASVGPFRERVQELADRAGRPFGFGEMQMVAARQPSDLDLGDAAQALFDIHAR